MAERQLVATFQAAGAQDLELPNLPDALAEFDSNLHAEPAQLSAKARQMKAWGLVA